MKDKKREPRRIVVAIISVVFIIFLWISKDIASIYEGMSVQEALPLVATTIAVSLLKVAVVAVLILVVKFIVTKIKSKK